MVASLFLVVASIMGCAAPHGEREVYDPSTLKGIEEALSQMDRDARPSPESGTQQVPPALDVDDCIAVAMSNSRRVRIADRRVLIARDGIFEAWTNVIPQISARGTYTTRNNDFGTSRDGLELVTGERDNLSFSVNAVVPIYDFGKTMYALEAVNGRADLATYSARRLRQEIEFSVSLGYFRVLESQKILQVVEESLAVVKRQLQVSREFLEQGLVASNDVLVVEVQLSQREQELLRAQNNVAIAKAALNRLMGVNIESDVTLKDALEEKSWDGSYSAVLFAAIDHRPDLMGLRKQIEIARAEYKGQAAGFAPNIYAFGSVNYSSEESLLNNTWLSGGIAIEIPIFDGGKTAARLIRKDKEIADLADLREESVDDAVLDVKTSYLRLKEASAQIPLASKGADLAQRNLEAALEQYSAGLLTSTDVLIEEDRLARAKSTYYQTLYGYHTAYAQLRNAVGADPSLFE